MKVKESLNVTFDETPPPPKTSPLKDDDLVEEEAIEVNKTRPLGKDLEDKSLENNEITNIKESKSHPLKNVIGNLNQRTLRSQAQDKSNFFCFLSTVEPININEALKDESLVIAIQEELNQFISNDVWKLVPNPKDMIIIRTKWVYRNKLDENGVVSGNKARLVAQGYNQQEEIDYDETYAPVARLESIRILLAYACALDFKFFQMDVNSAFLNGFINEEVYVAQPSGFIDFAKPDHIESHKSSTEHPIVNEFIIINIPEEDVEPEPNLLLQEIIIIDPDDHPMWENAKIVAPTPNSAIVQPNVDDNFVINNTHLKMILENKFDGYLQADPHDHIREFLAICNMFRYGKTQSEAVKLMIFLLSLSDEAKTWFNELNEESITSWEQMRRAFINRFFPPSLFNRLLLEIRNFSQLVCESLTDAWLRLKSMLRKCQGHGLTKGAIIQIFYHGLDKPTQGILDITAGGIFLYKSPNQAFQFLEDKVLFEHDWPIKSKNEHHQKSVSFTDGKELQDMRKKYNEFREENASENHMNDDTLMCERHEANYIQSEGYQNQNSHDSYSRQSDYDPNDSEKSLTELNNDVK
ncbi:reverse transcriptase domain-containing protein [Tanacetum coccineum]|uniref:Reverse transcriptase domain-containing protein n=1 Tax=Tanacetum coccineum TaxID=301880 RepID=A0ABQ5ASL6_9ASTR